MEPETRLNKTETQVVRYLKRAAKSFGAYEIQNALGIRHPITVYRALERLARLGFVHRLESQNAFIACPDPRKTHNAGFIVCQDCGTVIEIGAEAALSALQVEARDRKFEIKSSTIELIGRCNKCHDRPTTRRSAPRHQ
jgi:Fur family zinc uptake transcriptional regulator